VDHVEVNRANWDERARVHAASQMYGLQRYVDDPARISDVVAFDRGYLPDLHGKRVLHLQCHIGTDTLSLVRLGGTVTGYDVSSVSLMVARDLASRAGAEIRFVEGELYDAPARLANHAFDVVYTGVGAINWLPDIRRWAEVVATLLAPGGTLVIRDGHPVLHALNQDREDDLLELQVPYFETVEPQVWDEASTYTDMPGAHTWTHTVTAEWNHGIGEILTAVLDAGLTIRRFEEHRDLEWQAWHLWQLDPTTNRYRLPPRLRDHVPAMFTLVADVPA
jgi:SAM-dependent methyltransferase